MLRQLLAIGAVTVDAQAFNTLQLTDASRAVLKGDVPVRLRRSLSAPAQRKVGRGAGAAAPKPLASLSAEGQLRFAALKAWRSDVAKQHNLPAYVIFHDATPVSYTHLADDDHQRLRFVLGPGDDRRVAQKRVIGAAPGPARSTHRHSQSRLVFRPFESCLLNPSRCV